MSLAHYCHVPLGRALYIALGSSLMLATLSLYAATREAEEPSSLCRLDSLPQDVRESLSRNFSAWKIQQPADLSMRARTRWEQERPLTCPGIAVGHFQDPKNTSYALLLVPVNRASDVYRLVVYAQQSSARYYGFRAAGQGANGGSEVFVAAVPTVRYFEVTSKWVAHSHVSEAVMLVDSAATESYLYIWSDTAYERAQVNY